MNEPHVIAIDLGGTNIRVAVISESGRMEHRTRTATRASEGPDTVIARIGELVNEVAREAHLEPEVPIGVASPGPLNPRTGVVHYTPNLPGWRDVAFVEKLTAIVQRPVTLANDGNCGALGEAMFGSAKGVKNLVYLALGTGIGGGIISEGILIDGKNGLGERQEVLKFLDIGMSGIMAPRVGSAEEAAAAITYTKYSPVGDRGLAGGRTFDFAFNNPLVDYVKPLTERVLNIIQFEHVDTLKNLDAILQVPGVDVLFVGPNDLAQSLGLPGQPNHPEVTKVADEVIARCKEAGVHTGTVTANADTARQHQERGFDMLVPSATGMFGNAARSFLQAAKG